MTGLGVGLGDGLSLGVLEGDGVAVDCDGAPAHDTIVSATTKALVPQATRLKRGQ